MKEPVVMDHNKIDPNNSWENKTCSTATDRLEDGPEIPEDYSLTNMFTDTRFEGEDQLFWEGYRTNF